MPAGGRGGVKRLTQVELNEAAAIVDEAGGDAAREGDAVGGERAEGAARQLAQAALQGRQRGDQGPRQPGVVVQVQVAQALGVCQGAKTRPEQSPAHRPVRLTALCRNVHCVGMPETPAPSEHLSQNLAYRES